MKKKLLMYCVPLCVVAVMFLATNVFATSTNFKSIPFFWIKIRHNPEFNQLLVTPSDNVPKEIFFPQR